jgi:RND family efflux transporter MFP subunit
MKAMLWALLLGACGGEPAPEAAAVAPRVAVQEVRSTALASSLPVSAVLEAARWQPLYFQQSGVVSEVVATEGEAIRKGQRLGSLDTASQRNTVALQEVQLRSAELDLTQAEHDLAATQTMAKAEAASPEDLFDAEQRVLEAEASVESARLNLEGQRIKLRQMQLYAPFDGVLAEVNTRVGEQVMGDADDPDSENGTRPPMVVIDPSAFGLRASVPEGQATGLQVGLAARVSGLDDRAAPLDGRVSWVAPSVDRESRTVAFRVDVEVPEQAPPWVRDGSSVLVELLTEQREGALTVPDEALLYHRGESYVFVVDGGIARRTPIEQGLVSDGQVEVRAGLRAGQRVAVDQLHLLADGLSVRVEGADGG